MHNLLVFQKKKKNVNNRLLSLNQNLRICSKKGLVSFFSFIGDETRMDIRFKNTRSKE